jgi:hypothetical protein
MTKRKRDEDERGELDERHAKILKLAGPAEKDRKSCSDGRDVVSLQQIWVEDENGDKRIVDEIDVLFSYEEFHENGNTFIRAFSSETICSMLRETEKPKHPISGMAIPDEAIKRAKDLLVLLGQHEKVDEDFGRLKIEDLTDSKMEAFALQVFQMFSLFNIHLSEKDFMDFTQMRLNKLALFLKDMLDQNLPDFLKDFLNAGGVMFHGNFMEKNLNLNRQKILAELRRIFLKAKETGIESNIHILLYVIVGAFSSVSPDILKHYSEHLVIERQEETEGYISNSDQDDTR